MNDLANAFYKRYNRKVIVSVLINTDARKVIEIKYRDAIFTLTEFLVDGLTQRVSVDFAGKTNTLKTYLEAEVFVADKIGDL